MADSIIKSEEKNISSILFLGYILDEAMMMSVEERAS